MASFGVNPVSPEASKSWLLRKICPSWTGSKSTSHNHCDEVLVAGFVCATATLWPALGAEPAPPPNFAPSSTTGWLAQDDEFIPPPSGPGPIVSDPAHPYYQLLQMGTEPA